MNFEKYLRLKFVILFLFYFLFAFQKGWIAVSFYIILGFFSLDLFLYFKMRTRQQKILKELPYLIETVARLLRSNVPLSETLVMISHKLKGPLQSEVVRLTARYQIEGKINVCLDDFSRRINLTEVDHFCLALKQGERSGKAIEMLEKQEEILKRYAQFKTKKGTRNRTHFLPLVTVGMVINILLLTVVPMILFIVYQGKLFL
ncbi:MAG: type II secretion system F family protein [Bacillaceae bacterium]|nr:type II secretion system F family protein [Bacillaceae bacterium]